MGRIVFVSFCWHISWLVSFDLRFWWCALIIGGLHLCIDVWKSYRKEDVTWFSLDQLLHLLLLVGVAWLWSSVYEWHVPFGLEVWWIAAAIAVLICWKPANIFIKLVLKHYSVNMPQEKDGGFNAGALIGTQVSVENVWSTKLGDILGAI